MADRKDIKLFLNKDCYLKLKSAKQGGRSIIIRDTETTFTFKDNLGLHVEPYSSIEVIRQWLPNNCVKEGISSAKQRIKKEKKEAIE